MNAEGIRISWKDASTWPLPHCLEAQVGNAHVTMIEI